MKNKKKRLPWGSVLFTLAAFAVAVAIFLYGVARAGSGAEDQWLQSTQQAIRRAAVSCYAIEGIYPPNLQYMQEHYGLIVDEDRYAIHYNVYASNIMPDIDVIPIG